MVNTEALVATAEANQNSSKVTRVVDRNGLTVVLKNNKLRYVVVDFEEYEAIKGIREAREKKSEMTAGALIEENMKVFLGLVK